MKNKSHHKSGRIMFVLAWLMIFGVLFSFFHFKQHPSFFNTAEMKHGKLIVKADKQGHYRVKGIINQIPVNFLVDTGATMVAISKPLADKMNLKGRYPVSIATASGTVEGYLTRVDSLMFGDFRFKNVKAVIIKGRINNTVLLGMNILSKFKISQHNKQLILEK